MTETEELGCRNTFGDLGEKVDGEVVARIGGGAVSHG